MPEELEEKTAKVVFADARESVSRAAAEVFAAFGGAAGLLKSSRDVYIKVNAVDSRPNTFTSPNVLAETVRIFKAAGARNVYVIENSTQGNFTRLVFGASGLLAACRETGAIPVYLDETGATPVFLAGLSSFVDISSFVHERLVRLRDENLYVSLPKLKTHSMSTVTLSVKNQFGFVHQASRIADHNFRLHQKFADIYGVLRPDFVLVDGLVAVTHGHYPAVANTEKCVVKADTLMGGTDPLAVDTVAAAFMGFSLAEVPHLALCSGMGIGESRLEKIEIENRALFEERRMQLTPELLDVFPPDVLILRGAERCCKEGCRRNTETLLEVLYCDHGGKGGFSILMGRGIPAKDVEKLSGRVHIAGSCAMEEWGAILTKRLGRKNVTMNWGCNNLALCIAGLCRQMKVNPLKMADYPLVRSLAALLAARARKSRAIIPPLF